MALAHPNAEVVDIAEVIADMEEEFPELKADEQLSDAVSSGDVETVRQIINERNPLLWRAKHVAVDMRKPEGLRCLLEKDPQVDDCMEDACNLRDKESILMFLEFGWPINHPIRVDYHVLW